MFEDLSRIILSGKKYPIRCDMLVLEKIQNKYISIDVFEEKLIPYIKNKNEEEKKFPVAETVLDALEWMMNEGEAIEAEEEGRNPVIYTREKVARMNDMSLFKLANTLYAEFTKCFISKNAKTTQNQTEKTE